MTGPKSLKLFVLFTMSVALLLALPTYAQTGAPVKPRAGPQTQTVPAPTPPRFIPRLSPTQRLSPTPRLSPTLPALPGIVPPDNDKLAPIQRFDPCKFNEDLEECKKIKDV